MARANLTLQLDADVIRRARVVAAKRGMSVSSLAAAQLRDVVEQDDRLEAANARAQAILRAATQRGGRDWTRDELHERDLLRGR